MGRPMAAARGQTTLFFSQRDLLAIAVVVAIAMDGGRELRRSADIAARLGAPRRQFEQLIQSLAKADVLVGSRGIRGGYRLAREPSLISVYDIIAAARGIRRIPGGKWTQSEICARIVRPAAREAAEAFAKFLQQITVEQLLRSSETQALAVERHPAAPCW
jgi:Rrf2 family iron-sulfur cluster assembly transcriptional regulator